MEKLLTESLLVYKHKKSAVKKLRLNSTFYQLTNTYSYLRINLKNVESIVTLQRK